MKTFIKSVIDHPWLMMLGMYITSIMGIVYSGAVEWPFVAVIPVALLPTFIKNLDYPRWDRFVAMVAGALLVQALFWIV